MVQVVVQADELPDAPLDAAETFHRNVLPVARAAIAGGKNVALIFTPADHTHCAWRLAAVQELAREAAPARVNAAVGKAGNRLNQTVAWLAEAPGITGQLLEVDGKTAAIA